MLNIENIKLYTVSEVANLMNVTATTVYAIIKRGALRRTKIGARIYISEDSLLDYLKGSFVESKQDGNN